MVYEEEKRGNFIIAIGYIFFSNSEKYVLKKNYKIGG